MRTSAFRIDFRRALALFVCWAFSLLGGSTLAEDAKPPQPLVVHELKRKTPVDFEREILPVLKANCLACHNQTSSKADLILETPQTIQKGGESGPAVVPGKPAESLIFQSASHQKRPLMPPRDNKVAASELKPEELGLLKLWIEQGAKGEVRNTVPVEWRAVPKILQPSYAVALTPDGQFAACSRANQIAIYHLPSTQLVARLVDSKGAKTAAHLDLVQSLDFSPDGERLASSAFREVKIWRRSQEMRWVAVAPSNSVVAAIAPSQKAMALLNSSNEVEILNLRSNGVHLHFESDQIQEIALSPDTRWLAAAGQSNTLALATLPAGTVTTNIAVQAQHLAWLATNVFAFSTVSNAIEVWSEASSGNWERLNGLPAGKAAVTALHGIGDRLLVGTTEGRVELWDVKAAKTLQTFKQESAITGLALSKDGQRIAAAGSNKVVKLWAVDAKLVAELKGDHSLDEAVAASERKLTLAKNEVGFQKSALQSAEKEKTNQVARLSKATATNEIAEKVFSEKQKAFTSTTQSRTNAEALLASLTHELELATNKPAKTDPPQQSSAEAPTNNVANATNNVATLVADLRKKIKEAAEKFTTASNAFATAEKDFKKAELTRSIALRESELSSNALATATKALSETQRLLTNATLAEKEFQAAVQSARAKATAAESISRALAFSPDDHLLATADDAGTVHTWMADSGRAIDVCHGTHGAVTAVRFASPKKLEAISGGNLLQWALLPSWSLERTIGSASGDSPFADRVNSVRFSHDGRLLATGGGEPSRMGEIKLWRLADGSLERDLPSVHSDSVLCLDFSPDGKRLASGAADKFMRVSSLESGKLLRTFEGHTHHVLGVAWKADGRTLVSAGADGLLKVWNAATGERTKNIEGFGKEVTAVSFIGVTGQLLAAAGDGQLRLIKESGDNIRSFSGASDFLYAADATPDGKTVIASGLDGILRVWNGDDGKAVAEFAP